MRVITGTARGRRLREPEGMNIRPTSDMVKEAMFSIIQFDIEGRRVLDLFAGTGQLGIEAKSRGAAEVVFVDEAKDAVKLIRDNLEHCELEGTVVQRDALRYIERAEKFDLILIDAPFEGKLCEKALKKIYEFDILTEGGIIICETSSETTLPDLPAPIVKKREYRYGKIKLTKYVKEVEAAD